MSVFSNTSAQQLQKAFSGIIPPMVTPLIDDRTLDRPGLERLIEHLIEGGVQGIFALGTTGEAPSLSYALRRELIDLTCKQADSRVPIIVGITDSAPEESLQLARYAAQAGATAVVAAPPFYFGMEQAELVNYYRNLAEQSPLPLYLYNMPSHTKINIALSTVLTLSEHPNILGLKDSSGNGVYFSAILHALRGHDSFSLLVGPEEMMASSVVMGAQGGVSGGANMFPALYVNLFKAAVTRDHQKVAELQAKVMEISHRIYCSGKNGSGYLQGLKTVLSLMGICSGHVAGPLGNFSEGEKETIKQHLSHLNI